jgi:hypothetical protein
MTFFWNAINESHSLSNLRAERPKRYRSTAT